MSNKLLNKNYFNEKISGITYDEKTIKDIEFENCVFEKCIFVECIFDNCRFIDCKFVGCSISAGKPINSTFTSIKFEDSKIMGFDWTKAKSVRLLEFNNCNISYSNFSYLKLPHLKLIKCVAQETNFCDTDLQESIFTNTDFSKAVFLNTNLTKADFLFAYNYGIDVNANKIKKAKFSLPEAASLLRSFDIEIEY
jgi:fluoroquinolone resistance protein